MIAVCRELDAFDFASEPGCGSKNNIDALPFRDEVKRQIGFLVVTLLQQLPGVQQIILFGSYARAEYRATSDIDILALVSDPVGRDISGDLHSCFDEKGADLVIYTVDDFNISNCLLVNQIRKDGVLLWEK